MKRLRKFNISLLGIWVWKVLEEKEILWYKMLGARYGEEEGCGLLMGAGQFGGVI
jgi:hypothetical protein